jgi:hypothetical protein
MKEIRHNGSKTFARLVLKQEGKIMKAGKIN